MKFKKSLRLLVISLAITSLAAPMAAQAGKRCCSKDMGCYTKTCSMSGKGGIMYNEYTGKYYRVSGDVGRTVYRGIDNHYIPVATKSRVNVACRMQPGHWWGTTWMAPSQECWYIR